MEYTHFKKHYDGMNQITWIGIPDYYSDLLGSPKEKIALNEYLKDCESLKITREKIKKTNIKRSLRGVYFKKKIKYGKF